MERLTEKRQGQNVIPLRQDGKTKWAICSAGSGDCSANYLYGDYSDRLAAYEDLEEQGLLVRSGWISVEERLPDPAESDWVIGVASGRIGTVTYQNAVVMVVYDPSEGAWYLDSDPDQAVTVTHWMPVPEPPKEERADEL